MMVRLLLAAMAVTWATVAAAQQPAAPSIEAEQKAAFEAAGEAAKHGPGQIPLLDQAKLDLSQDFVFIPQPEAGRLMRAMGNTPGSDLVGVVYPSGEGDWFAVIRFVRSGYIKDDDAKEWDVDDLLDSLREGTEQGNEDRTVRGFPALEVKGWIEKPAYESQGHRLVWSALAVQKGASGDDGSVNYNTYALGREGYFSLNLVTSPAQIQSEKRFALQLLSSLDYVAGKRYEDFNPSTDHVAEYGLAGLVAGAAAKKLGLFALIGVVFAKFGKIIVGGLLALGYGAFKLFRRPAARDAA